MTAPTEQFDFVPLDRWPQASIDALLRDIANPPDFAALAAVDREIEAARGRYYTPRRIVDLIEADAETVAAVDEGVRRGLEEAGVFCDGCEGDNCQFCGAVNTDQMES